MALTPEISGENLREKSAKPTGKSAKPARKSPAMIALQPI